MNKLLMVLFVLPLFGQNLFAEDKCHFALDTHLMSDTMTYRQETPQNVMVGKFDWNPQGNFFKLRGVYDPQLNYELNRSYIFTWPTWAGNGVYSSIYKVSFIEKDNVCKIIFHGRRSSDRTKDELHEARFKVTPTGLWILWPEIDKFWSFQDGQL